MGRLIFSGFAAIALALGLGGCATVEKPNAQLKQPEQEKLVTPQEIEQRKQILLRDLEKRIRAFSPIVSEELDKGQLRFELKESEEKILSAYYDGKKRLLGVECSPDYSKCNFRSIEHELGHHVWKKLSSQDKESFKEVMQERLRENDAERFNEKLLKLQNHNSKASSFTAKYIDIVYCMRIDHLSKWKKYFGDVVKDLGLSELEKDLEEKEKMAYSLMPTCNGENIKESLKRMRENLKIIVCLKDKNTNIYHKNIIDEEECPSISSLPIEYDVSDIETAILQPDESFYEAVNNAITAIQIEISKHDGNIAGKTKAKLEKMIGAYKEKMQYFVEQKKQAHNNHSMVYLEGVHDECMEEQFAAVVASLYVPHNGPVTMGPMKLKLTEPLLGFLEKVEYKGQRIFSPQVERYRTRLK